MRAFIKITISIVILISLGFTYMSAKQDTATSTNEDVQETTINGDEIAAKTYKLVRKTLVKPYDLKTTKEPNIKMFSRCKSGNWAEVREYASTENEYSYGAMNFYKGCERTKIICKFRARLSDNSVDVLQSDSVSYIAADLWIEKATISETKGLDKELAEN